MRNYLRPEVYRSSAYQLSAYPEAIKLNQNELPYDLPPKLKKKLWLRFGQIPLNRYPLPQPQRLQKKMAEQLGVEAEQIQFANGSNVLIQSLILATALHEQIMVLDPGFSVYEIEGKLLGNRIVKVALRAPDFSFPIRQVLTQLKKNKVRLLFISNPNAPTGNLFPEELLIEVLRQAKCLVVIDEAYHSFSNFTLLPHLQQFSNLVILRTFSKGFGLGGARIGYAVAQRRLAENIAKLLLPYCLSVFSEEAALFALEHSSYFQPLIAEVLRERERMFQAMSHMPHLECFPSQTNFILFRVADAAQCFKHLLDRGVLIRNVSNLQLLQGCLRVSVGKPEENDAFLKALRAYRGRDLASPKL